MYNEQKSGDVPLLEASVPFKIGDHAVWVQVQQDAEHRDVLIDDIVREFFGRVGWITFPILLILLVIDLTIFPPRAEPAPESVRACGEHRSGPDRRQASCRHHAERNQAARFHHQPGAGPA